jgi:hypothetical protein
MGIFKKGEKIKMSTSLFFRATLCLKKTWTMCLRRLSAHLDEFRPALPGRRSHEGLHQGGHLEAKEEVTMKVKHRPLPPSPFRIISGCMKN